MSQPKNKNKYVYLGLVADQKVCRIPEWDVKEILKRLKQGWLYSTKEAWIRFQQGSEKIFLPTEYPTGTGNFIFSHIFYPARAFQKPRVKSKSK